MWQHISEMAKVGSQVTGLSYPGNYGNISRSICAWGLKLGAKFPLTFSLSDQTASRWNPARPFSPELFLSGAPPKLLVLRIAEFQFNMHRKRKKEKKNSGHRSIISAAGQIDF